LKKGFKVVDAHIFELGYSTNPIVSQHSAIPLLKRKRVNHPIILGPWVENAILKIVFAEKCIVNSD